ncbi:uncharacterized protein BDZ99DRAFT_465627 [Mytilinidion resinicola]|uniref:F-box domain-containing protein n=1 Tax=Mytilinidion resinicola TaxID=574789 RepID=A0A6A6YE77_9PEZI|nr:uncharacterized protein BDZ99DRAFT_465627 [Mytilinidion resinicola]KAF2806868.1 hypothetical protein BDZ99DRAFT_465627 [Mytilinidion resinicola]
MGTATQQVLALPELLSTILQHVHADQSLLSCMLVNSLWEHEATTIQWAEVDELPLQNTDPDRQQYYSDKVRKCSVKLDDAAESMLSLVNHRSLVFPRLKSVKLHGYQWDKPTICDSRLHPLLPSTLRNIEIELHDLDNLPSLLELTAVRKSFISLRFEVASLHFV